METIVLLCMEISNSEENHINGFFLINQIKNDSSVSTNGLSKQVNNCEAKPLSWQKTRSDFVFIGIKDCFVLCLQYLKSLGSKIRDKIRTEEIKSLIFQ